MQQSSEYTQSSEHTHSLRARLLQHASPALQHGTHSAAGHSWCKRFTLPHTFIAFQGHFPDKPVLPAVVQILMAELTVAEVTQHALRLTEIIQAKFTAPIEPDSIIDCIVTAKQDNLWDCTMSISESIGDRIAAKFRWRCVPCNDMQEEQEKGALS